MKSNTELFNLLKTGSTKELEDIIEETPSSADVVNEQGVSLLLMAVYSGKKEAVEIIKRKKKSLSPWEAVCTGEHKQLDQLIDADPLLINEVSPDGFSLLGYACFFRQEEIAKLLIAKGANVNAASQNAMKVAPLHSAAASSDYNLCKLLLDNSADVNATQQGGYTPLHAAAQNGKIELAKLLLDYGADKNLLTEKGESAIVLAKAKSHTEIANFIENYK